MAKVVAHEGNQLTLQVTVTLSGSLMAMEKAILDGCNVMGSLATVHALQKFDTDGSPIKLDEVKLTMRDKTNKLYQTPYGGAPFNATFINRQKVERSIAHWKRMLKLSEEPHQSVHNKFRVNMPT